MLIMQNGYDEWCLEWFEINFLLAKRVARSNVSNPVIFSTYDTMALVSAGKENGMGVMECEDLKKLVNDYIDDEDVTENLETRRKDIYHSFKLVYLKNPLIHIVDTLSFALTDINVEKRAKGTGLLAECIHQ